MENIERYFLYSSYRLPIESIAKMLWSAKYSPDRFQEWREDGLFERKWQSSLLDYDNEKGLEWEWQSIDGAMSKAPLGGAGTGASPTDLEKKEQKEFLWAVVKRNLSQF